MVGISSVKLSKLLATAVCSLLLVAGFSPRAWADVANKKTIVTFSAPVEVPGLRGPLALGKGTYVFKILDVGANRNIVQIFNKDETHLYTTFIAVPNYRLTPTDKTVITFAERPVGSPMAIKAWFYPGDNYGQEFVYPKTRALELAKAAGEPVLSMPNSLAPDLTKRITSANESAAKALENAQLRAEEPSGKEVGLESVVQSKPTESAKLRQKKR